MRNRLLGAVAALVGCAALATAQTPPPAPRMPAARGGLNTALAVPSAPGNSETDPGSTTAQPAASPRTSRTNSSTTVPVFRILISTETAWPGSTVTAGVTSVTEAPTGGVYHAGARMGRRRTGA
jgi:hypothetical protein